MNQRGDEVQEHVSREGAMQLLWKRKGWWLMPLAVLLLLLGVIFALVRLSHSDSEMYPTTMQVTQSLHDVC